MINYLSSEFDAIGKEHHSRSEAENFIWLRYGLGLTSGRSLDLVSFAASSSRSFPVYTRRGRYLQIPIVRGRYLQIPVVRGGYLLNTSACFSKYPLVG